MTRRRLQILSSLLLVAAVAAAGATGQIAFGFDINRFALHRFIAYSLLALVHVILVALTLFAMLRNWPRLGRRFAMVLGVGLASGAGADTAFGTWQRGLDVPPKLDKASNLGVLYHRWSYPTYVGGLVKSLTPVAQPPIYKEYPAAAVVVLPKPSHAAALSVNHAIRRRRSRRGFFDQPLTLEEFSDVLFLAAGETDRREPSWPFRALPSSGALYPTEMHLGVRAVEGLQPGIYHYRPATHGLDLLNAGDHSGALMSAAMDQEMVGSAGTVVILASLFDRTRWEYKDRSYRYSLVEAGPIGQNLYLAAETLKLSCCAIAAFFDDRVNRLLGLDDREEATTYMLVVGHSTDDLHPENYSTFNVRVGPGMGTRRRVYATSPATADLVRATDPALAPSLLRWRSGRATGASEGQHRRLQS